MLAVCVCAAVTVTEFDRTPSEPTPPGVVTGSAFVPNFAPVAAGAPSDSVPTCVAQPAAFVSKPEFVSGLLTPRQIPNDESDDRPSPCTPSARSASVISFPDVVSADPGPNAAARTRTRRIGSTFG
jgi:hypothetical protein